MSWISSILDRIEKPEGWGFRSGVAPSGEPTAWASLALAAHGRLGPAVSAAEWLLNRQTKNGSVGLNEHDAEPGWTTSLAILCWQSVSRAAAQSANLAGRNLQSAIERGTEWLLSRSGEQVERHELLEHDSSLVGWSWIDGTHSWMEPTAYAVLALKSCGLSAHPRVREGVRLMIDRLLPDGGCNYGNKIVLGTALRPHLQPSGVVLTALAGEDDSNSLIEKTANYVAASVSSETTASSLAWGLTGLASRGRLPSDFESWLESAANRTARRGANLPRLSLLALAALGTKSPLITLPRQGGK